jgi:ELWxxDGT repeat protein
MRAQASSGVSVSGIRLFSRQSLRNGHVRRRRVRTAATAIVQALESRTMFSASLVKDINATFTGANPQNFVSCNGKLYFTANDSVHGTQLWKSDGTAAGTIPVTNLVPGEPSAVPDGMVVADGELYFFASNGTSAGLWKSDGTEAGTSEVFANMYGGDLTAAGDKVYFMAAGSLGPERPTNDVWVSDGTAAGTVDIAYFDAKGPPPENFSAVGDRLYFTYINEFWTSDGTTAGTVWIQANVPPVSAMTEFGGRAYFTTATGLWTSDGTTAGTYQVNTEMIEGARDPAVYNGEMYFGAFNGINYNQWTYGLWKSDGTAAGTAEVTTVVSTTSPDEWTPIGPFAVATATDTLVFAADDPTHGYELWRTDGTAGGTALIEDLNPGPAYGVGSFQTSSLYNQAPELIAFGGKVLFNGNDGLSGVELWETDGTAAGTTEIAQLNSTITNGAAIENQQIVTINGESYFDANDGVHGEALWKSDGTAAGTSMVADLATNGLVNVAGTLFFDAWDGTEYNLYKTDGTPGGTSPVFSGGRQFDYPADLTAVGGSLYFIEVSQYQTDALYVTDGTTAGTRELTEIPSMPASLAALGNELFFTETDAANHLSLWQTDGTSAGTIEIESFAGTRPLDERMLAANGYVYFEADDGTGLALWKTNGSSTVPVWNSQGTGGVPFNLYASGDLLYFTILSQTTGTTSDVYTINLTTGTTTLLATDTNSWGFTAAGGQVFFKAVGVGAYSRDLLYVTDGTAAGTRPVTTSLTGSYGDVQMEAVGDVLYFIAQGGGEQLWETDGNTVTAVSAPNPPNADPFMTLLGVVNGQLLFSATDATHGDELWETPVGLPSQLLDTGFESPPVGSGSYADFAYDPADAAWQFSGTAGIAGNGSGFTAQNADAPEGTQAAFLQMAGSSISQTVSLAAGTYQITFDAAQRVSTWQAGRQDLQVLVDGQIVGTFTPTGGNYAAFQTATFTVAAGNHKIAFLGLDSAGGDNTALIDAVRLVTSLGLSDGGFESPGVGANTFSAFQYAPTGTPWTFTSLSGTNGSGIAGNGSGFTDQNPNAPEGTQVGFIQGTGSISQTVSLAAGTYQITFDAAQRVSIWQASQQNFEVLVDGQVVGTFTPSGGTYAGYQSSTFTVAAGNHRITFQGLDTAGGDNTALMDNVQVAASPTLPAQPIDAGFESPAVGANTFAAFQYAPTGTPWTFTSLSGTNGSGIAGNGSGFTDQNPNAPEGAQVGFIQGTGSISQTVSLAAGTYQITFDAAQRVSVWQAAWQDFQVLVDGQVVGTFAPEDGGYVRDQTGAFTVAAGAHTITFKGLDSAGGDNTALIDAVQLLLDT